MKQHRKKGVRKATTFEDARVRPAIRNQERCREMHCPLKGTHQYGAKGCDWVMLADRSVISRTEASETTTRPDREGAFRKNPFAEGSK